DVGVRGRGGQSERTGQNDGRRGETGKSEHGKSPPRSTVAPLSADSGQAHYLHSKECVKN
ncbi:hypothetical protein, partial [Streptomyces sp. AA4]|uniref:hypothetical protein n=1 Tax=Streptomyces sp. AA4 TaxID=591158 RepID=UPI0025701F30